MAMLEGAIDREVGSTKNSLPDSHPRTSYRVAYIPFSVFMQVTVFGFAGVDHFKGMIMHPSSFAEAIGYRLLLFSTWNCF